jgi:copper transport protein
MKRFALFLAAFVALAVPVAAGAHATLKSVSPGFQQELASAPTSIVLTFDQIVSFPSVQVLDQKGHNWALPATIDDTIVKAVVRQLPRGNYTVRWHALSADSHVVSGVWTFGVGVPALPPTEAYGASGPTRTEHIVRWLYFGALATVIGALGVRLLCLRGLVVPPRVEKRILLIAGLGTAAFLELGILAFCMRCEDVLQLPFEKFLYGDLSPISGGTRFGTAFIAMTLGFAVVAAFVYLSWLLDRVDLLWPPFLLAVGFASGISLSGHDAVDPGSFWATEVADWVHLVAASLWVGGLLALVLAVWPGGATVRVVGFVRFSRLAVWLVAITLGAGTYLSIVRLPHLHDLWRTGYGQTLIVKLMLVALALAFGAVHHFVVRPRLERAGHTFLVRAGRSLAAELAIAIAVLLVAAVLTDSKPPIPPGSIANAVAALPR